MSDEEAKELLEELGYYREQPDWIIAMVKAVYEKGMMEEYRRQNGEYIE